MEIYHYHGEFLPEMLVTHSRAVYRGKRALLPMDKYGMCNLN